MPASKAASVPLSKPLNRRSREHVVTSMGSHEGSSLPRRSWLGIVGAALLVASGAIHLDLYLTGYRTIPTIGPLFLLQVIAAFVLAAAILITGNWLAEAARASVANAATSMIPAQIPAVVRTSVKPNRPTHSDSR